MPVHCLPSTHRMKFFTLFTVSIIIIIIHEHNIIYVFVGHWSREVNMTPWMILII